MRCANAVNRRRDSPACSGARFGFVRQHRKPFAACVDGAMPISQRRFAGAPLQPCKAGPPSRRCNPPPVHTRFASAPSSTGFSRGTIDGVAQEAPPHFLAVRAWQAQQPFFRGNGAFQGTAARQSHAAAQPVSARTLGRNDDRARANGWKPMPAWPSPRRAQKPWRQNRTLREPAGPLVLTLWDHAHHLPLPAAFYYIFNSCLRLCSKR